MNAVINELNIKAQEWKDWQFDNDYGMYNSLTREEVENPEGSFWFYKMCERFKDSYEDYADIIKPVLYDYEQALDEQGEGEFELMGEDEHTKMRQEWKQDIIRNMEQEKILMLYKKVPTDIINEMLQYMGGVPPQKQIQIQQSLYIQPPPMPFPLDLPIPILTPVPLYN